MFIPEEVLPVVLAAAGGRDPRKYLKGVHVLQSGAARIIEAASGLLLIRATWHDPDGSNDKIDLIVSNATWKKLLADCGDNMELIKPNSKGRAAITITSEEDNQRIDFKPVEGSFPELNKVIPYPYGTREGRPPEYHQTLLDPKLMERLMRAFVQMGATSVEMNLSADPEDPIVFHVVIGNTAFVGLLMPKRSAEEMERPIDESGAVIAPPPEKEADEEEASNTDNMTPDFIGDLKEEPDAGAEEEAEDDEDDDEAAQ